MVLDFGLDLEMVGVFTTFVQFEMACVSCGFWGGFWMVLESSPKCWRIAKTPTTPGVGGCSLMLSTYPVDAGILFFCGEENAHFGIEETKFSLRHFMIVMLITRNDLLKRVEMKMKSTSNTQFAIAHI